MLKKLVLGLPDGLRMTAAAIFLLPMLALIGATLWMLDREGGVKALGAP